MMNFNPMANQNQFNTQPYQNQIGGMNTYQNFMPPNQHYNNYQNYNYSNLSGRFVNNPNDIRPNEISMDGNVSLFPMSDGSCIYAKSWNTDGSIQTMRFIPEAPQTAVPSEFSQLMNKLDGIEQMLSQSKSATIKKSNDIKKEKEYTNE